MVGGGVVTVVVGGGVVTVVVGGGVVTVVVGGASVVVGGATVVVGGTGVVVLVVVLVPGNSVVGGTGVVVGNSPAKAELTRPPPTVPAPAIRPPETRTLRTNLRRSCETSGLSWIVVGFLSGITLSLSRSSIRTIIRIRVESARNDRKPGQAGEG